MKVLVSVCRYIYIEVIQRKKTTTYFIKCFIGIKFHRNRINNSPIKKIIDLSIILQ